METESELRRRLVELLKGGNAYEPFESIAKEFTPQQASIVPEHAEHSAWQIVCHMQLSMKDTVDWSTNEDGHYQEKDWPEEYWPKETGPATDLAWQQLIDTYVAERAKMEEFARTGDLLKPFAWEPKHNLLRNILLAADHASYHCGQLVLLRSLI